jgi:hypothetical protein
MTAAEVEAIFGVPLAYERGRRIIIRGSAFCHALSLRGT